MDFKKIMILAIKVHELYVKNDDAKSHEGLQTQLHDRMIDIEHSRCSID